MQFTTQRGGTCAGNLAKDVGLLTDSLCMIVSDKDILTPGSSSNVLQSQRKALCYYCESSICKYSYLQTDTADSASKWLRWWCIASRGV